MYLHNHQHQTQQHQQLQQQHQQQQQQPQFRQAAIRNGGGLSYMTQQQRHVYRGAAGGFPPGHYVKTSAQQGLFDQFSDHSTSCGSEENNPEDFLDSSQPQYQSMPKSLVISSVKSVYQSCSNSNNSNYSSISSNGINTSPQSSCSTSLPEEAKYKTEMCKNWVESGKCNYGDKCKFAHGKHELVQKVAANKHFKTKPCKQFFEFGICSYGPRCHFLHDTRTPEAIAAPQIFAKKLIHPEILEAIQQTAATSKRLDFFQRLTGSTYSHFNC